MPTIHGNPGPEGGDPRFTVGLLVDVRQVLVDHGYPALTGHELAELRTHLFHLLCGKADVRCFGKSLAAVREERG